MMINYIEHDNALKCYYDDHLTHANAIGFNTVSEAIHVLYCMHNSVRTVAKITQYSKTTILKHLKRMGIHISSRGGNNKGCEYRHDWAGGDGWMCSKCGIMRADFESMEKG